MMKTAALDEETLTPYFTELRHNAPFKYFPGTVEKNLVFKDCQICCYDDNTRDGDTVPL